MIYELRTYWAAPGKLDALLARFRNLTLGIFARHNMQVVGFWTPNQPNDQTGDLVYIMAFPDQATLDAAWQTFRDDPEWQTGKAASEVDGPLTTKLVSTILQPTDFSPMV